MIRFLDVVLASVGLVIASPALVLVYVLAWMDTGSPLFRQERVGRHQRPFVLLKFRTMRVGTPSLATHLIAATSVTRFGAFLRRTKLDELPQLCNVLVGEMSLVGPRPCLFNQADLVRERESRGVFNARPGITGLAQVRGVDMSIPETLAELDATLVREMSLWSYLRYVLLTLLGRGAGDRVRA